VKKLEWLELEEFLRWKNQQQQESAETSNRAQPMDSLLLKALRGLGGANVALQDIYRVLVKKPFVTKHHKEAWSNGQPRYQCWIREYISKLVKEGIVKWEGRGRYSLIKKPN
jgi:hypothetical protein